MDLLLECKHCGEQFDPNSDDAKWAPPTSKESNDIGSIICPNGECGERADFSHFKTITDPTKVSSAQDDKE